MGVKCFVTTDPLILNVFLVSSIIIYFLLCLLSQRIVLWYSQQSLDLINNQKDISDVINRGIRAFNFESMIRTIANTISDPKILETLISLHHQKRSSIQIEYIRFLSLFPSRRRNMLLSIDQTNAKSLHNMFILQMIRNRIASNLFGSSTEDRISVNMLYHHYVSISNSYWTSRLNNHYTSSFVNGVKSLSLGGEMVDCMKKFVYRFPFDSVVRKKYIQVLLISGGDAVEIINQKKILHELEVSPSRITDQILHQAISIFPNMLKFLNEEEKLIYSYSSHLKQRKNSKIARNSSSQNPITNPDHENGHNSKPIWTYLSQNKSTKYFLCFGIEFVILVLSIFTFIARLLFQEYSISSLSSNISQIAEQSTNTLYLASSGMLFPFSVDDVLQLSRSIPANLSSEKCQTILYDCLINMINFYDNSESMKVLVFYSHTASSMYFRKVFSQYNNICTILAEFVENPSDFSQVFMNNTKDDLNRAWESIEKQHEKLVNESSVYSYFIMLLGYSLIALFLLSLFLFFILNRKMNRLKRFFGFLSSDERKQLILCGKSEDSWNILNQQDVIFENSIPITTDSNRSNDNISGSVSRSASVDLNLDEFDSSEEIVYENYCVLANNLLCDVIFPLFNTFIVFGFFAVSYAIRNSAQIENLENVELSFNLTTEVILLQHELSNFFLYGNTSLLIIDSLSRSIANKNHPISTYFLSNHSLGISLYDSIQMISNGTSYYAQSFWRLYFIPEYVQFSHISISKHFANNLLYSIPFNNHMLGSLIIITAMLTIYFFFSGYSFAYRMSKNLQILFAFPYRYIEISDLNSQTKYDYDKIIPENLLCITTIKDTNQIYCTTSSSQMILGKKFDQLMGTKFNDFFIRLPQSSDTHLFYGINEKRSNRVFLAEEHSQENIKRHYFVDDSSRLMSSSTKKDSFLPSNMIYYMPSFFAEKFFTENEMSSSLNDSVLFYILLDSNSGYALIERFFSDISIILTEYSALKLVSLDGSVLTFLIDNRLSALESIILIKEVSSRANQSQTILKCVYVDYIESAPFTYELEPEPYVNMLIPNYTNIENHLFTSPPKTITINQKLEKEIPIIYRFGTLTEMGSLMSFPRFFLSISSLF